MNIALVCGRDIRRTEDTDGGSVLVRNLTRELQNAGHNVEIFVPKNVIGGTTHVRTYADEAIDDFSITRFPVNVEGIDLDAKENDPHAYFTNRMAISEREADFFKNGSLYAYDRIYIIHIAHAFGLLSRNLVPVERTVVFPMMLGHFYGAFESVPAAYIETERRTLMKTQHIASVSDAEKEVLTKIYEVPASRIYKVSRGYDAASFQPCVRESLPQGRINILCANVIKPQKNQRFFLELVEAAKLSGLNIHIYLVGVWGKTHRAAYNQYAEELTAEVTNRGMSDQITFVEVLPQHELSELMKQCAIALYPSCTETFGKSALESMATGLPTIVFDTVPAFREFITHNVTGCIVSESAGDVLATLQVLRNDSDLYRQLSENGIEYGRSFTWTTIIEDMLRSERTRIQPS